MKIQCDVCNKRQASLFCTADEAALCSTCDHRVHHANKLASKHRRFSLNHPNSPNHFPLCDICLERRGFVFCQEDRAIVCKECDLKIHGVNEHTKKHNRFLLSGIKLHSPAPPPPTLDEETGSFTISEYLINTIPGWKFEDFLDSPSSVPSHELPHNHIGTWPLVHDDANYHIHQENILVSFPGESMCGICVPQAPLYYSEKMDNRSNTINEATNFSSSLEDFTVPQITMPPN